MRPDDTEVILAVDSPIEVRTILLKRTTQHLVLNPLSLHSQARIVLQVTEIQDLIIENFTRSAGGNGMRAFTLPRGDMITPMTTMTAAGVTSSESSRLWFEVEVLSLAANETMKGEGGSWKVEDAVSKETSKDLWRVLEGLAYGLDGFEWPTDEQDDDNRDDDNDKENQGGDHAGAGRGRGKGKAPMKKDHSATGAGTEYDTTEGFSSGEIGGGQGYGRGIQREQRKKKNQKRSMSAERKERRKAEEVSQAGGEADDGGFW